MRFGRRGFAIYLAAAVAALVTVGVAAGASPKQTLTVVVSGSGTVRSHPSGITCRPACKLRGSRGEKVTLTAVPAGDAQFSHWSAPCGTSATCTVRLNGNRVVHAYFAEPAPPPTPTPTPTPAPLPAAKPGHYVGSYSDGSSPFTFDVSSDGTALTNLSYDFNGHCSDGGSMASDVIKITGTFPIGPDGSFSGDVTLTYNNASGTSHVAGNLTSSGSGSGTLNVSLTFNNGGATCSSTGTWTAQDQS